MKKTKPSSNSKIKWKYVSRGFALNIENVTALTLASMSLGKENIAFTENDLKNFAKIQIDIISQMFEFRDTVLAKNNIDSSEIFEISDFKDYNQKYLYKYVNENSVKYYKKGLFQVGSVGYFQNMENENARDELEGLSFVSAKTGTRVANAAFTMGSNYYIFCATRQNNDLLSNYHIKNFGNVLMKIEIEPFAKKIAKRLGAVSYRIMNVNYSNAKTMKIHLPVELTPESISHFGSDGMQVFMRQLIKDCTLPCLLTKPTYFIDEIETRILFELPYNVHESLPRRFEHKGLLKYIDFI